MNELDNLLDEAKKEIKAIDYSQDLPPKLCNSCGLIKPGNEFYIRRDRKQGDKYGRVPKCKLCSKSAYHDWYINLSPDRKAEAQRKGREASYLSRHKGRLTKEEAEQLSKSKLGTCEICGRVTEVFIDHCHASEIRRGFLCESCNFMLGMAKDNITVLINAVKYLTRFLEKRLKEF